MAGVVYVVGVLAGFLNYYQFGPGNFGAADGGSSVVRLQVGLDGGQGLTGAGGGVPDVRLFNDDGDFLGLQYDPGIAVSGAVWDVRIGQDPAQPATYVLLTGNDDAICLAYVTLARPDGQRYGWTGNWAQECGHDWYYSNVQINGQPLECAWVVASPERPVKAFQIHFPDFWSPDAVDFPYTRDYYCEAGYLIYYQFDQGTITVLTDEERGIDPAPQNGARHRRRLRRRSNAAPTRPPHQDSRLVISSHANQTASALCASPGATGPDFVNTLEGLFCRMSAKTLHPLCRHEPDGSSGVVADDCFDLATRQLVLGGVRKRDVVYSATLDWRA